MKKLVLLLLALSGCANRLVDDVPRLYACDRAEGLNSCPGGWRCGLSGFCQDPAQALPYACESSDDCSAAWHCGAERLCYDRAAAVDRSCRAGLETIPDAGDCAPGWRCGRELRGQVCHALDAGAGYLCSTDSDCEATWRCGPEGACVDVAAQGLRGAEAITTAAKVSPLLPGQVDLLQVVVTSPTGYDNNRAVFIAAGRITVATNSASGSLLSPAQASLDSTPLLHPAHALAETEEHLLVTDSTGLVDYRDALDAGTATLLVPSLANAELRYVPVFYRYGARGADEELASFSGTSIGLCARGASFSVCDPLTFQFATLPGMVKDIAFVEGQVSRRQALAATSVGPYFAPRAVSFVALDGGPSSAPAWRPMVLPGLSDGCAATPTALDRLSYDPTTRQLAATTDQDRRLSLFKPSFAAQTNSACAALPFDPEFGPCTACGPGETLLKLGSDPLSRDEDPGVLALCQRGAADAGGAAEVVAYRHHSLDGGCSVEPLSVPSAVRQGYRVTTETPGLQGIDSVGTPRACAQVGCDTMLSAVAPDRVAGGPGLLGAHVDDVIDATGHHEQPSAVSSALGLRIVSYPNLYVAGSVTDNPDWMIGSSGSTTTHGDQSMMVQSMRRKLVLGETEPFVLLNRSSNLLPSVGGNGLGLIDATGTKSFSSLTTDADGQPWLIIGAGDRLWADDARLVVEDGGIRTLGIKVVPLPSADIQALAFAAYDRGDAGAGPLLDGYTVEQQRLFRVVVHTAALWLSDEIRLGETSTVPVSVWMEGRHGRVGTSDGRVFGLPVPVPLSPTIPEAPLPTVLNFGSLCGQAFALSPTALYRLSLETPPLGTWKRVSLEAAHPGVDGYAPHWAAVMHQARVGNEEHLYLFSQTGLVVELKATCP